MAMNYGALGRDATPRIGEWMSEAFTLFAREWQTWVVQGIVFYLAILLPIGLALGVSLPALLAAIAAAGPAGQSSNDAVLGGAMAIYLGAMFTAYPVTLFLVSWLMAGMMRTAARQLRGEPISVGHLFSGGSAIWPLVGAGILLYLGVGLGSACFILPGLLLMGLWIFVHPLIAERGDGVFAAFRESWEITKPHMWMYLLWAILISLVMSAGSLVICGVIATLPLSILMWMISYRDAVGIPGAVSTFGTAGVYQGAPTAYGPAGPPTAAGRCPQCGSVVAAGAVVCPECRAPLPASPFGTPPGGFPPPGA